MDQSRTDRAECSVYCRVELGIVQALTVVEHAQIRPQVVAEQID